MSEEATLVVQLPKVLEKQLRAHYYASEGSGGIRLLKKLNQLKKTLQQNRSFL